MIKKIVTLFAMFFVLFSCGSASTSSSSNTIAINLNEEGKSLDPQLLTDTSGIQIHSFLSEGLTKVDVNTKEVIPALAEKWEISEDGLVWTFHLRDGIKWSNGDSIVAGDFKYAWLRALDPEVASEYAYMLYYIKNAEEYNTGKASADDVAIKVIDDKTLEVTLNAVTPYFGSLTSFITYMPANEKFITEKGDQFALEADTLISTGAFILKEWVHNSEMTLVKNDNYYNKDKISLDEVKIKFIADSSAALNAFKNDELDVVKITAEQYQEFKDDARTNLVNMATVWYLSYNTNVKVLSNVKVRQALLQAIDKEELIETIFNGINSPAYTLTPKGVGMPGAKTSDFATEVGTSVPKFNAEEAKKLLQEGLKELGLTEMPTLSIILNDSGSNKKIGEAIQAYFKSNLGIDVNIELMAFKERIARMQSKNFDIVLAGWGADYQDPMTFLDLLVTNGGNNYGSFSNAEYDKAIKAALVESNQAKRFEYLKTAEEIIAKETPIALLMQARNIYLVNPRVENYTFQAIGSDIYFVEAKVK